MLHYANYILVHQPVNSLVQFYQQDPSLLKNIFYMLVCFCIAGGIFFGCVCSIMEYELRIIFMCWSLCLNIIAVFSLIIYCFMSIFLDSFYVGLLHSMLVSQKNQNLLDISHYNCVVYNILIEYHLYNTLSHGLNEAILKDKETGLIYTFFVYFYWYCYDLCLIMIVYHLNTKINYDFLNLMLYY